MNKTLRNLALVALAAAPFSAFAEIVGSGTAEDPYQIASAEDLGNAYKNCKNGVENYFVQTADIDMEGVEEYIPVNTLGADWSRTIIYDGCNHVIKNFGPKWHADGQGNGGYYVTSIFGVLNGTVKNLGVVDVNISTSGVSQRAGVLCAYAGSSASAVAKEVLIENVYVTGKVVGGTRNTAGLGGINQLPVTIKNCYVDLELTCEGGTTNAMLIGEVKNKVTVETTYLAGKVAGPCNFGFGTGGDQATVESLVIFAEGADAQLGFDNANEAALMANTAATKDAGIEEVLSWGAFEAGEDLPVLKYALSGAGTEEDPYQIASAEDLCNAYRFVHARGQNQGMDPMVYFVQTADIDMEGVEYYTPIIGWNGSYAAEISYDGQNHIISNFAPNDQPAIENGQNLHYYCTSVFGIPSGEIKNLGVVDAYAGTTQGAGILGAYGGHGWATALTLENVFVTGTVDATGGYTGGMFGTTGNELTLINCFANVEVTGKDYTAGLVGRIDNPTSFENVYVAGTVSDNGYLVGNARKAADFDAYNVIAFNTGAADALNALINVVGDDVEVATEETKAELIETVQGWNGYTDALYVEGYPALDGFNYGSTTGLIDAVVVDGANADAPAVYYNLQGVQVANPDNGIFIVRRGNTVTKELLRK